MPEPFLFAFVISTLFTWAGSFNVSARPLIGYMNPIVSVIQGDDLELNCEAIVGNPKPKVLWLQHGMVLRLDKHIKKNSNGNLVIRDVQSSHDGDYICLATNVGGNASIIVSVDVQGEGYFPLKFEVFR